MGSDAGRGSHGRRLGRYDSSFGGDVGERVVSKRGVLVHGEPRGSLVSRKDGVGGWETWEGWSGASPVSRNRGSGGWETREGWSREVKESNSRGPTGKGVQGGGPSAQIRGAQQETRLGDDGT